MTFKESQYKELKYLVAFPDGYDPEKKYPVIISIHGAGSRGTDAGVLYENGIFKFTKNVPNLNFVCVVPLCHGNTWFDVYDLLKGLVLEVAKADYTDTSRIYLMGVSMGGYATWQLAMSMPELFAAIVPICGGGMYWNAARLANVPVWAFHGAKDRIVYPEESEKMVKAVLKFGGEAKLTIYPENEHNAWEDTFSNPEVYEWLLSHKNKNENAISDAFNRSDLYG